MADVPAEAAPGANSAAPAASAAAPCTNSRRLRVWCLSVMGFSKSSQVKIGVAEQGFDRGEALEVVADVELVGDADAAVELDRLLADAARGAADAALRRRHGA